MSIELLGKRILTVYDHYVYRLQYEAMEQTLCERLIPFQVNSSTYEEVQASTAIRRMMAKQPNMIYSWGFRNDDSDVVGHLYLMKRGGNEVLYRIRSVEAYVFAVRVFDDFRGKRYAGEMITWLMNSLHAEGIDEMWLTVKKENYPAIRAYERLGFERVGSSRFIRFLGINIPYRII